MPTPSPEVVAAVPRLAPRDPDANKGDFGRVLIVAGSRGMSGAAVLCASAALRGGAGLVRLAVPAGVLPIAAAGNPCYMTAPLPEDDHGRLSPAAASEVVGAAEGELPPPASAPAWGAATASPPSSARSSNRPRCRSSSTPTASTPCRRCWTC